MKLSLLLLLLLLMMMLLMMAVVAVESGMQSADAEPCRASPCAQVQHRACVPPMRLQRSRHAARVCLALHAPCARACRLPPECMSPRHPSGDTSAQALPGSRAALHMHRTDCTIAAAARAATVRVWKSPAAASHPTTPLAPRRLARWWRKTPAAHAMQDGDQCKQS